LSLKAKQIKRLIKSSSQIAVITHINPDGDAIGSALALYNFLQQYKGKKLMVAAPNDHPVFLKWMQGDNDIKNFNDQAKEINEYLLASDLIFCLDFNSESRLGNMLRNYKASKAIKVLIDHHPDPENFTDYAFTDTSFSSTAEILYEFLKKIDKKKLNKGIAECIYAGIMTDTGCFSFNSSRPLTFRTVAELLKTGINKDRIFSLVYDNYSANRMRLLGFSLNEKMVVLPEFKTAYISLTKAEMDRYKFENGDSESFVNLPLSIKGIIFSAIFLEKDKNIKISLRSKGDFPTNIVCKKYFNGGGHVNASGGESYSSLEETIKTFEGLLPEYKDLLLKS
jgi:bifunctional oligoribonuclease and PAP phosphatase NrnA